MTETGDGPKWSHLESPSDVDKTDRTSLGLVNGVGFNQWDGWIWGFEILDWGQS